MLTTHKKIAVGVILLAALILLLAEGGETVRYLTYLVGCWTLGGVIADVSEWFVERFWSN